MKNHHGLSILLQYRPSITHNENTNLKITKNIKTLYFSVTSTQFGENEVPKEQIKMGTSL